MGPSGSGKSTFLNIAGLLDDFDGGTYELDAQDVSRLNDAGRSRIRNTRIGFIFQAYNLIPELNVFDNVDVPLRYRGFGSAKRKELIMGALDTVGLAKRLKHFPAQLSGGQQQRVAIARALAGDPKLILPGARIAACTSATARSPTRSSSWRRGAHDPVPPEAGVDQSAQHAPGLLDQRAGDRAGDRGGQLDDHDPLRLRPEPAAREERRSVQRAH
jgi:hypothetical protein